MDQQHNAHRLVIPLTDSEQHQSPQKGRLDLMLVERGLVPTRSRARDLILRGGVRVDGQSVSRPSAKVDLQAEVLVSDLANDVSRGASKLRAGLSAFGFDPSGRICLDVGASTGGFTQVLLEGGACKVYSADVGRDQLAAPLREDKRVVCLEGRDARGLTADDIVEPIGAIVSDVSFISLTKALTVPLSFARSGTWLIALIKPQFEVGPDRIGKGGIVRDEVARQSAIDHVTSWFAARPGWHVEGVVPSPIEGGSGNKEFLLGARFDVAG